MRWLACLIASITLPAPASALDLLPPGAVLTREIVEPAAALAMPVAPWSLSQDLPFETGAITRRAYRLPNRAAPPTQITASARNALEAAGYDILFACSDRDCGGFDFRFQLSLIPAPDMFVDLGNYRYLIAKAPEGVAPRLVSVLASRAGEDGTFHVTEVSAMSSTAGDAILPGASETPSDTQAIVPEIRSELVARLQAEGHIVLSDVVFTSGSETLPDSSSNSLEQIAAFLQAAPGARVVFVGHTDAVGSLAANTALSKRRAEAVADAIRDLTGISDNRIDAAGAGYLAPIASNLTEEGRAANRRVEVVLLSQ